MKTKDVRPGMMFVAGRECNSTWLIIAMTPVPNRHSLFYSVLCYHCVSYDDTVISNFYETMCDSEAPLFSWTNVELVC